jgi:D-alanine-D-alanine ligase
MKAIPIIEGEDPRISDAIWITQYLDENNIRYTGSNESAHKLECDKSLAKEKVLNSGLKTSEYFVIPQNESVFEYQNTIEFPLFVKPLDRGGGLGVDEQSVVHDYEQLNDKINQISTDYGSDSLVEKYLPGREFTVAVIRDSKSNKLITMPIEQLPIKNINGDAIIGQAMKESDTETAVSLVIIGDIKRRVEKLALDVFTVLGARDYGRIDMRLDEKDMPVFLEANLIPSLIEGSGNFPKACVMNRRINYEDMILRIVNLAFKREETADYQKDDQVLISV